MSKMKVRKDKTGMVFGWLLVEEQDEDYVTPKGVRNVKWKCRCLRCGNYISVTSSQLTSGNTVSCGCYRRDKMSEMTRKYNDYDLSGEYGVGYTSNTNRPFLFDLEDFDKIKKYCWAEVKHSDVYSYVSSTDENFKCIRLHNVIIGDKMVDHINRDIFDNRKSNLRLCDTTENCRNRSTPSNNTSGVMGVGYDKESNKWRARIGLNGKRKNLGRYDNFGDAVVVRLNAEKEYYKEFAPQQHLYEQYGIV